MTLKFKIKTLGKEIWQYVVRHFSRDLFVFLFFLFVSAVFWLLQTLDETFERDLGVPIQLVDVPQDIVITTPLPEELTVTIRDRGATFLRYWRHRIEPLAFSYPDYVSSRTKGYVRIPESDVMNLLAGRLQGSSKVLDIQPDTLEFYFNHGRSTMVPVRVDGVVETDSRHYLLSVTTEPKEVEVFASSSVLDTLTFVPTETLNLSNLSENETLNVRLHPVRGAKVEPSSVQLTATVDVYIEQTVEVPIVSLNFPGGKQLCTFPANARVTYTIGHSRSKEIDRNSFVCAVTYEEILALQQQGQTKIPLRLRSTPDDIIDVRLEPREVDYLIETISEEE